MNNVYILIMAGGEGTRFQPLSTPARPKQFINIVGDTSLIRQTFDRLQGVSLEHFFVATNARYIDLVHKELPELPVENIIGETVKKNTAPCIAYAAHVIKSRDPHAVMICLPSDHVITNTDAFHTVLSVAIEVAKKENLLVTLGIKPTRPATEYGYIEKSPHLVSHGGHQTFFVKRFVEKPNEATAKEYVSSGNYYWNSGMFVWKAQTILDEVSKHLPELFSEVSRLSRDVSTSQTINFFESSPSISIDYGVMERSHHVAVIPCDLGWSDVGTWQSLKELEGSGTVSISPIVKSVMDKQI